MKLLFAFFLFAASLIALPCSSQIKTSVSTGIGYQEHFTLGIGLHAQKHALSLHYGSNFFIRPQDFFTWLVQYDYMFKSYTVKHCTPKIGIKAGYSVYTNTYYQWELASLTAFAGIVFPLSEKINLASDFGVIYSRELHLKRINYGEVGWYKTILPEIKFSVFYLLQNN